jgi:hypothetical protein
MWSETRKSRRPLPLRPALPQVPQDLPLRLCHFSIDLRLLCSRHPALALKPLVLPREALVAAQAPARLAVIRRQLALGGDGLALGRDQMALLGPVEDGCPRLVHAGP